MRVLTSFSEEICPFWYAPQLNWSWKVYSSTLWTSKAVHFQTAVFWSKSFFSWNDKFLQILIHVWCFIDVEYSFTRVYQTAWSVLLTFLPTLIVYSIKKRERFLRLCTIACKKRTDWILKIFSFNKNSLYLWLILKFQCPEGQSRQAGTESLAYLKH